MTRTAPRKNRFRASVRNDHFAERSAAVCNFAIYNSAVCNLWTARIGERGHNCVIAASREVYATLRTV
jgi:hypothetical protein